MAVLTAAISEGLLRLVFLNEPFLGLGDAGGLVGSGVSGALFLSMHTADPGPAGNQGTNEVAYPGYGRLAVTRDPAGVQPRWKWGVGSVTNEGRATFAACAAGGITVTHLGIGVDAAGVGVLLYRIALAAPHAISAGASPYLEDGASSVAFVTT